ncbi:hypothetical protein QE400_003326 [Xanthomonas sacchari]|uniref:hypothetical protein n=1 Tax=Xanthomonas sacchari TaxID=56458 RepID=UPI0027827120|nr:hypothetical protein [Xanthomonas sacchari]
MTLKRIQRVQRSRLWQRSWLWKNATVVAGGGWLQQYRHDIRDDPLRAERLRADTPADVTLCQGHLCANVEPSGPADGDRRQYRLLRPR